MIFCSWLSTDARCTHDTHETVHWIERSQFCITERKELPLVSGIFNLQLKCGKRIFAHYV
jgi:hypothetical protein